MTWSYDQVLETFTHIKNLKNIFAWNLAYFYHMNPQILYKARLLPACQLDSVYRLSAPPLHQLPTWKFSFPHIVFCILMVQKPNPVNLTFHSIWKLSSSRELVHEMNEWESWVWARVCPCWKAYAVTTLVRAFWVGGFKCWNATVPRLALDITPTLQLPLLLLLLRMLLQLSVKRKAAWWDQGYISTACLNCSGVLCSHHFTN